PSDRGLQSGERNRLTNESHRTVAKQSIHATRMEAIDLARAIGAEGRVRIARAEQEAIRGVDPLVTRVDAIAGQADGIRNVARGPAPAAAVHAIAGARSRGED